MMPEDSTQEPKECENWIRVDCPQEILALRQEQNWEHFGQSANCNLTTAPLDLTMEFTGACSRAEAMLNGTYAKNLDPPEFANDRERHMLKIISFSERDVIWYLTPESRVVCLELIPISFDLRLLTFCARVHSSTYDFYAV